MASSSLSPTRIHCSPQCGSFQRNHLMALRCRERAPSPPINRRHTGRVSHIPKRRGPISNRPFHQIDLCAGGLCSSGFARGLSLLAAREKADHPEAASKKRKSSWKRSDDRFKIERRDVVEIQVTCGRSVSISRNGE